jgi:uncharacterized membrane protein
LSKNLWKQKQLGIQLKKIFLPPTIISMEISKKRHLAKTFTWRLTATLTTMVIAWLVSGDPLTGLTVGGIEFFVKMPIYYFHERVWYRSNFGLNGRSKRE